MGRKKTPTALRLITGNPSGRPMPKDEPQPPEEMPKIPTHLCKDAKKEWNRIAPVLHNMGVLTQIVKTILAAYCSSYAMWEKAWRALNKMEQEESHADGLMIETTNGNLIQNPLVGTANKAAKDMISYASELGMTPAARTKIKALPKSEKNNKNNYFE